LLVDLIVRELKVKWAVSSANKKEVKFVIVSI